MKFSKSYTLQGKVIGSAYHQTTSFQYDPDSVNVRVHGEMWISREAFDANCVPCDTWECQVLASLAGDKVAFKAALQTAPMTGRRDLPVV